MRHPLVVPSLCCALAVLGGCDSLQRTDSAVGRFTPYRIDVVQGNAVTREQVARVKPGMTRLQVRDVMGTPLLADPFHAERWDYVFTLRRIGAQPQRRGVMVVFDGDVVREVKAPELPTEADFVASISRYQDPRVPKLELSAEERAALPPPVKRAAPAAEPMGPVREYPPLEKS